MNALNDLGLIIGISLMYAAPLMYTALGGVMTENSGVVNIGLEGMMTIGAFVGATVGFYSGNPWLAFLCAGLAGGVLALLHAVACVTFSADQVVSGIAINFLGPGLSLFLSRVFFDGATMTKPIPLDQKMPRPLNGVFAQNSFLDLVFNQYATVYLAFLLVFIVWYILYKTKIGLRIRAVGEHPRAADTLGIDVYKVKYLAVILSGVFAGFGGAAMSLAAVSNFRATLISGQGFIALAAMIFGKWTPQGSMWACLLFGVAQGLVVYLGGTDIRVSSQLLAMIPYVITLIILMSFVGKATGPAANGIPYEKNEE
ncbi:simple sugar transport system permease protein [Sporanaerobacter acetigenes DSM 13106]|uniref:Simple sugar transport system permease protein n=2 Tax=Sporanaerobacter acetigenes TaxID=165813 RepID=A0A1M5X3T3_9FIRM|nr:simple sugar transport system permease protein [Sporanaerobacter acetigenes DSM 13106]